MGGCITPPKKPKAPVTKPHAKKSTLTVPSTNLLDTTLDNLNQATPNQTVIQQKIIYKKVNRQQFKRIYRIEDNVGTTTRTQGPKYISNYSDGLGKVLRVIPFTLQSSILANSSHKQFDLDTRLKAYSDIIGLEVYQDLQNNILVLQDYYCGPYLHQLLNSQHKQQQIRQYLSQIYTIIDSFHQKNIILGNLSLFSFRQVSQHSPIVQLIQLNFLYNIQQNMGHAFKAQKSMDWQSFGYIVQSVYNTKPPIFIQHKLQYIQNNINTINTLLKGRKIKRQQLDNITYINIQDTVINGYKFRYDINKFIKLRKRRLQHNMVYYAQDIHIDGVRVSQQVLQRIQTSRIFQRIQQYIQYLTSQSQQSFLMYSTHNQTYTKLKSIFNMPQRNKKIQQLKQVLPLIK